MRIIIYLVVAISMLCLVDCFGSKKHLRQGLIVDKQYESEHHSVGTGYGVSANGQPCVIVTNNYEGEKFMLMVKTGNITTIKCEPEIYYSKNIGDSLYFYSYKGLMTNFIWANAAIK